MADSQDSSPFSVQSTRTYRQQVEEAASFLRDRMTIEPTLALLYQDGLWSGPEGWEVTKRWTDTDIPHFPQLSDAAERTLGVGHLEGTPVVVLNRALSLHEGFTPRQVTFPVRVLAEMGIETVCLAHAAGSLTPEMEPTDLVLVSDHINFQGVNPLVGPNVEEWGPRFPDMTNPYDPELQRAAEAAALEADIPLRKGIYLAVLGPNRGTQAEYRMSRTLGADMVGMNAVPEVIVARHMDLRVLGVSVITDRCTPEASGTRPDTDVDEAIHTARPALQRLLTGVVTSVGSPTATA